MQTLNSLGQQSRERSNCAVAAGKALLLILCLFSIPIAAQTRVAPVSGRTGEPQVQSTARLK